MPAQRVRWDYDSISQFEGMFLSLAEIIGDTRAELVRRKEALQGGDWIGEGADAFYREMDDVILPAFDRLVKAMAEGARTMRKIGALAKTTEDEASRLLSRAHSAHSSSEVIVHPSNMATGHGDEAGTRPPGPNDVHL